MWPKYLQLATFANNIFNTPNLGNYSLYELVFRRKPNSLLNVESTPDIKVTRTFKEYYELLNKRLKYLNKLLLDFKSKKLAMINKNRDFFQYNSGDKLLDTYTYTSSQIIGCGRYTNRKVYINSPLTSQLHTTSRKIMIKFAGPVVIYKIIDPHNYLLMMLDGKILRGLFKHKRLKPANIRTNQGNFQNLAQLKQVMNVGLKKSEDEYL